MFLVVVRRNMKTFKRSFGLLLVIGLIAAACGTDGDDDASSSAAVATTAAPVATTAAPAAVVETSEDESTLPDLGGRTVSVAIELSLIHI